MFPLEKHEYSILNEEDTQPPRSITSSSRFLRIIASIIALITTLILGIFLGHHLPIDLTRIVSPQTNDDDNLRIFKNADFQTHTQRLNGSFFKRSVYSGEPNPRMDAAWARYTETGSKYMPEYPAFISVPSSDALASAGYSEPTLAHLSSNDGEDGYMASLEMFHQIHCLDMIRKFIHFDYYARTDPEWASAGLLIQHADHCVDTIRQILMCNADIRLITYHWIKGYSSPMPDFSTSWQCRDPEAVLKWTKENEVLLNEPIRKPKGATQVPELF